MKTTEFIVQLRYWCLFFLVSKIGSNDIIKFPCCFTFAKNGGFKKDFLFNRECSSKKHNITGFSFSRASNYCCHNYLTVTPRCNIIPVGNSDTEKMAEAVLFCVCINLDQAVTKEGWLKMAKSCPYLFLVCHTKLESDQTKS